MRCALVWTAATWATPTGATRGRSRRRPCVRRAVRTLATAGSSTRPRCYDFCDVVQGVQTVLHLVHGARRRCRAAHAVVPAVVEELARHGPRQIDVPGSRRSPPVCTSTTTRSSSACSPSRRRRSCCAIRTTPRAIVFPLDELVRLAADRRALRPADHQRRDPRRPHLRRRARADRACRRRRAHRHGALGVEGVQPRRHASRRHAHRPGDAARPAAASCPTTCSVRPT
jgi:hypothetical protein